MNPGVDVVAHWDDSQFVFQTAPTIEAALKSRDGLRRSFPVMDIRAVDRDSNRVYEWDDTEGDE